MNQGMRVLQRYIINISILYNQNIWLLSIYLFNKAPLRLLTKGKVAKRVLIILIID